MAAQLEAAKRKDEAAAHKIAELEAALEAGKAQAKAVATAAEEEEEDLSPDGVAIVGQRTLEERNAELLLSAVDLTGDYD